MRPFFYFYPGCISTTSNPGIMSRQIYYEANGPCCVGPRPAGIAVPFSGGDPLRTGGRLLQTGKQHDDQWRRAVRPFHKALELKKPSGVEREKAGALFITGRGARLITSRPIFAILPARRNRASPTQVSTPGRLRSDGRRVRSPLCAVSLGPVFHTTADAGN